MNVFSKLQMDTSWQHIQKNDTDVHAHVQPHHRYIFVAIYREKEEVMMCTNHIQYKQMLHRLIHSVRLWKLSGGVICIDCA